MGGNTSLRIPKTVAPLIVGFWRLGYKIPVFTGIILYNTHTWEGI